MISINFERTYDPTDIKNDLSHMTFDSPQADGTIQPMLVKIEPHPDPYLPKVYNLGFGPPDGTGRFFDNVRLKHLDNGKVFSTVLFHGLTFLQVNTELTLRIDGSDNTRATIYHLMFKTNRQYLSDYFIAVGVDWYVRVFRNWQCETDNEGNLLPKPRPEPFDYERARHDLYRYYMFHLKPGQRGCF